MYFDLIRRWCHELNDELFRKKWSFIEGHSLLVDKAILLSLINCCHCRVKHTKCWGPLVLCTVFACHIHIQYDYPIIREFQISRLATKMKIIVKMRKTGHRWNLVSKVVWIHTLPKTTCFPSSQGVGAVVIKNLHQHNIRYEKKSKFSQACRSDCAFVQNLTRQ